MFRFVEKLVLATRIVLKNVSLKIKLTHFFIYAAKLANKLKKNFLWDGFALFYRQVKKTTFFSQDFASVTNKGDAFSGNLVGFIIT